ncbi:hypothetical protein ANCCAN_12151 [Ancylostoma caninum]|uniref:Uncharacterized protein n=1 Tax=Ancylostoma caninum TaxID=29170 RepID=A0A368GDZ2_ANCCA|nr:hypothetical protein ANCCAN_12151 [Ancylostoma caninum]
MDREKRKLTEVLIWPSKISELNAISVLFVVFERDDVLLSTPKCFARTIFELEREFFCMVQAVVERLFLLVQLLLNLNLSVFLLRYAHMRLL